MGTFAKDAHRRAVRAVLTIAAAVALALGVALPAAADEVGTEEGSDFDIALHMEVVDVADPNVSTHPVTVTVVNSGGDPVVGATVAYSFKAANPEYYVPPRTDAPEGEYATAELAQGLDSMVLSGEAVTDSSGTVRVGGIVRGCDYEVRASAAEHKPYVNTHTCKGLDSESWEIVMERASAENDPLDGSGSGAASDGNDSGTSVSPIWLAKTGDAAFPWLLALSGLGLSGFALAALARRKKAGANV